MLLLLVLVAFARLCDAGIYFQNAASDWDVRPGEKFHLKWTDQVDKATIELFSGSSTALELAKEERLVTCEFAMALAFASAQWWLSNIVLSIN